MLNTCTCANLQTNCNFEDWTIFQNVSRTMKLAFALHFMRRSRKHTGIGILGVKSHSYRTNRYDRQHEQMHQSRNFFPPRFMPNWQRKTMKICICVTPHATISEAHRHRNPRREIAFLPYNRQREHMRHSRNFLPLGFMQSRGVKIAQCRRK